MIEVKKLSEQEVIEAKKEIANALKIDEKYIYYGVSDSKEFIITDAYVKLENGGVAFDNLNTKILTIPTFFDVAIFIKYPISFFYCEFPYSLGSFRFFTEKFYALSFDHCNFLSPTYLNHLSAYACIFSFCHFKKDFELNHIEIEKVYFENCIFEKRAVFKGTTFGGDISLYGSTFKQCPNFAQCRFEGELNLVNTNLAFDFKDTEKQINLASKNNNNHFVANDFRDSFRLFKNTLSKEGNLLDASNYHRVELYCKEIELDSKPNKKLQDKIDKWQLWFYRLTSDHYTDLLRSFNTLIALIGIFGLLCGSVVLGLDYFVFDYQKGFDILQLKSFFFKKINKSITSHLLEYFVGNVVLVFVFLGLFLGVVWKCSRDIFIALGYVMTLGFLATSPKYLIPVMSLFGGGRAVLDPLGIVGGVYTLLFGLIAYSLIKTARKNSIIPS